VNVPLSTRDDLTAATIERLLSDMVEAGCLWLWITGGEPLVREDFPRIYAFAKRKGFLITLFTNATLLSDEHIALLKDMPPRTVEVTVYGATEAVYERVTRVRGSYRRCLKGVERLASIGAALHLKTVALSTNWHEVAAVERIAQRFGAGFRFDPMIMGRVDRLPGPLQVRMDPIQTARVDMGVPTRVREWLELRAKFPGPPSRGDLVFQCGAGAGSFFVDASGRLLLCP
jgi:MoaA/NifB/PqqE/SkfB family radical SAM enzyme